MEAVGKVRSGRVRINSSFFFQAEDGIRGLVRSRGLGDVYKRQHYLIFVNIQIFGIIFKYFFIKI